MKNFIFIARARARILEGIGLGYVAAFWKAVTLS